MNGTHLTVLVLPSPEKLQPDNEELSLLAAIALFTPTRNGISDPDDMAYLESIQVVDAQSLTNDHMF